MMTTETPMQAKSLMIGASGQLGAQVMKVLGRDSCLVTARKPQAESEIALDLEHLTTVAEAEKILDKTSLDAIYCLAGMTNVEACEDSKHSADATNRRGPAVLAAVAAKRSIPFVYFSTEYIFDGLAGPYDETQPANPLSIYGRSKWEGEQAVQSAYSEALILRTTVVYGYDANAKNYVYAILRNLAQGRCMRVPEDQVSTPTYNCDLATATVALVQRGERGVFHVCGPERMGRLAFAQAVAYTFGLDHQLLQGALTRELGQRAPRPLSAGLSIKKLSMLHPDLRMKTLSEGLADCYAELEAYLQHGSKIQTT